MVYGKRKITLGARESLCELEKKRKKQRVSWERDQESQREKDEGVTRLLLENLPQKIKMFLWEMLLCLQEIERVFPLAREWFLVLQ